MTTTETSPSLATQTLQPPVSQATSTPMPCVATQAPAHAPTPGAVAAVVGPEPATFLFLSVAAAVLLRRRADRRTSQHRLNAHPSECRTPPTPVPSPT